MQLAEPGILREHRRAFAVKDPLELRRPDAVAPSTQGATGVPPVAGLHRSTAFSPVAAYRVRRSFSRRTLFSMYESNGFMSIFSFPVHFPFFANRRSRLDFGFGPFAGRSDANPPAFGAIPQHLPVVEYFIPFRL